MILIDGEGIPLSVFTLGANVAEVHAIENLVDVRQVDKKPERLVYDKAADADWLRGAMEEREIELICPHRRGRKKPPRQDGRSLRRYARRYKVERTISWLQNFRRLVCRYERYPELFESFAVLACTIITLKRF